MVDFCLSTKGGKSSLKSERDLIVQQVDILFDTTPTEVLGFDGFGTEYDKQLYNTRLSAGNLKSIIDSDLEMLNLFGWSHNTDVYLMKGTERDIVVIDIKFRKGGQTLQKTYNIV